MSYMAIQGGEEAAFNYLLNKSKLTNSHDIAELVTVGGRASVRPLLKVKEGMSTMMQRKLIFMLEGEVPATMRNFRVMLRLSMSKGDELAHIDSHEWLNKLALDHPTISR